MGRATPTAVYDVGRNRAGSVWAWIMTRPVRGGDDPPLVAVDGPAGLSDATRLLITADAGGSNGSRVRLWKVALQELADETGFPIAVCHFPPGTSKWNKIEHRLFSYISQNWRGKPLRSFETIVSLIAGTTTATGLKVHAELNTETYHGRLEL